MLIWFLNARGTIEMLMKSMQRLCLGASSSPEGEEVGDRQAHKSPSLTGIVTLYLFFYSRVSLVYLGPFKCQGHISQPERKIFNPHAVCILVGCRLRSYFQEKKKKITNNPNCKKLFPHYSSWAHPYQFILRWSSWLPSQKVGPMEMGTGKK